LLSGVKRRVGYDEEFLEKWGAAAGSTIAMTPTGFMTQDAWEEITPKMVEGIRSLPYIKENPQWFCLEIFDGFGPHTSSLYALEKS
jgi:hypothetical protein